MPESDADTISFHARVEKGHRILIPIEERALASIAPGDLVHVTVRRVRERQEAQP